MPKKLSKKDLQKIKALQKKFGVSKHEATSMYVKRGF